MADTPNSEPISFPDPEKNDFVSGQNYQGMNLGSGLPSTPLTYLFNANVPLRNVVVNATIDYFIWNTSGTGNPGIYYAHLAILNAAGTALTDIQVLSSASVPDSTSSSAAVTGTFEFNPAAFTMATGEKLILYFVFSVSGSHHYAVQKDMPVTVEFEHKTTAFNVQGIRYHRWLQLMLDKMTNNTAVLNAPMFTDPAYSRVAGVDTRPYNWIVLCGDSIRGTTTSPFTHAVLKAKWTDVFQDATAKMDVGMSVIGNTVNIAPRKEFYNTSSLIFDMGEVTDVDIMPATDYVTQTIAVGYKDQEYDQLNGRYEYNAGQTYLMQTINKGAVLDLVSPFSHSQFAIYNQWINYIIDKGKNSKTDNEIFIIEIGDSATGGYYAPIAQSGTVTGVLEIATAYNMGLTPHHNLIRNGGRIRSGTYRQDNGVVKFQKADRNAAITTNFGNGYYNVEYADVYIANLKAAYFQPMIFAVEKTVPVNLTALVAANPNGYISFKWRGRTWKLFPDEVATTPARPKKGTVKGLAAPDQDLRNLA